MTSAERIIKIDNEQLEFDVRIKFRDFNEKFLAIAFLKENCPYSFLDDLMEIFEGKK